MKKCLILEGVVKYDSFGEMSINIPFSFKKAHNPEKFKLQPPHSPEGVSEIEIITELECLNSPVIKKGTPILAYVLPAYIIENKARAFRIDILDSTCYLNQREYSKLIVSIYDTTDHDGANTHAEIR